MKVSLYDNKGKKTAKTVDLAPSVFEQKVNMSLLNQAVYVYLSNQRQSNAHTKDRGDVSGGGKKPWKQKGTGRARAGSSRSPIWKGGGVTFGPTNDRNFKKGITRKMKKGALRSALSVLARDGKIAVMERIELGKENFAKQVDGSVKNLNLGKKVLIIQKQVDSILTKTVKNIKGVDITHVGELNVPDLLSAGAVVFFEEALEDVEKFWGSTKQEIKKAVKSESKKEVATPKKAVKVEKKVKAAPKKSVSKKTVKTSAKGGSVSSGKSKITKKSK